MQQQQQQQEEPELFFELINPTFSPNKGISCHIVAAWDRNHIKSAEVMLNEIDNIEVFKCTEEEDDEDHQRHREDEDEEEEEEEDRYDDEEEDFRKHPDNHGKEELPIIQLNDQEKEEYIRSIQPGANNPEKKGGASSTQSPQLIKTTNLVKFLSKTAKQ